jgi:hypothetical protein
MKHRPALQIRAADGSYSIDLLPTETTYGVVATALNNRDLLNGVEQGELRYSFGPREAAAVISFKVERKLN